MSGSSAATTRKPLLNQCVADTDALIATLAAFGGFFADMARRPSPAGLPTVRAFQQAQADVVCSWLQEAIARFSVKVGICAVQPA
ncbi:hypothetical protein [Rugosimonospora africana]|uniref:Uncharacterized protein n=1 Tax=Rugosimonospora africana TaxID=556532 RepID=A0A8J3R4Z8_9ACTN|nr:hypothetical protein [Rugosimonospora africana]GIH21587.1 hypothetical protein Raf01_97590 [Rugosimonospora africana]